MINADQYGVVVPSAYDNLYKVLRLDTRFDFATIPFDPSGARERINVFKCVKKPRNNAG